MRRRTLNVVLSSAGVAALVAVGGVTSAASARTAPGHRSLTGALVPAGSRSLLPRHGGTVDSLNWSGYAVTPSGGGITAVASTFKVPAAGLVPPGFAATWAGIGGYSTKDLIQAGIAEQSLPNNPLVGPQYYAWYELLPNSETPITGCSSNASCTVTPGDVVTVNIHQIAGTSWSIAMTDAGHWTWSKNVTYRSSQSSAEWILEAPTLAVAQTLMAPVGTVSFGPTSTWTAGGVTRTIGQGNPTTIVLSPGVVNEATPSGLAPDGQSFNDCAYAQTCPAP